MVDRYGRTVVCAIAFSLTALACQLEVVGAEKPLDANLVKLLRVGPNGKGVAEAREAARRLSQRSPTFLPQLLRAMDTDDVVAANWVREVFQQIWDRHYQAGKPLVSPELLKEIVLDAKRQGRLRRLALDKLRLSEPDVDQQLWPHMLDDPEFRGEAVAWSLRSGDASKNAIALSFSRISSCASDAHTRRASMSRGASTRRKKR